MCVFCDIGAGKVPAKIVVDEPEVVAFHDIDPKAPVHVLVIPKVHISSMMEAELRHTELLGKLLLTGQRVARQMGLEVTGCRFVINAGPDGGQSVDHLHLHVLGGRKMKWPPG